MLCTAGVGDEQVPWGLSFFLMGIGVPGLQLSCSELDGLLTA